MRQTPVRSLLFPALFACGALATFVLPFYTRTGSAPIYSTAWACGAENRSAYVALAILSLSGVLLCWRLRPPTSRTAAAIAAPRADISSAQRRFGFASGWLVVFSVAVACWSLGWGSAILHANLRVGESNYFLEQTRNAVGIGLPAPMQIYRDLEFPYGPLLLEAPVWLWHVIGHFGVSAGMCYVLGLTAFSTMGFLMLVYILRELPVAQQARGVFAVCGAFVAMNPLFGPNYSLFKFLSPVCVLLLAAHRKPAHRFLLYTGGSFLVLMISPELSVGLTGGILVQQWVLHRTNGEHRPLAWFNFLTPLLALAAFLACYGSAFLERLRLANSGALNLVIQPMPDVLILLAVVTWLAPALLGRLLPFAWIRARGTEATLPVSTNAGRSAALLLALFVLGLGMLPGALGRSDPLHIFFNGLPFWLLSLVAVHGLSRNVQRAWLGALILLSVQVQADNFHFYARSMRDVVVAQQRPPAATLDVTRLDAITHHTAVTTPVLYAISLPDEALLRSHGLLQTTSAPGLAEVWNQASEERRIREIRQTAWALVPKAEFLQVEHAPGSARVYRVSRQESRAKSLLRNAGQTIFGFPYKEKREPYAVGSTLLRELQANWQPVAAFGDLLLYRRVR